MHQSTRATWIGLTAILFWAAIVGLIRSVSEHFGAWGGGALIYSAASILLLFTRGFPNLRTFPRRYLWWGAATFVAYELCLALSIGLSDNAQQAIEVGMVNYLWPTFTILSSILFLKTRASLWILPGFLLSMAGIVLVLQGDQSFDFTAMTANVRANPLSYGLALIGAFLWAGYSTITARFANNSDGITPFFMLVALTLWIAYAVQDTPPIVFTPNALMHLVLAALAMGLGYAAWNVGILRGNLVILAGASYFIPVLSAIFAATWLSTPLSSRFWVGASLVTLGSILCWVSTQTSPPSKAENT